MQDSLSVCWLFKIMNFSVAYKCRTQLFAQRSFTETFICVHAHTAHFGNEVVDILTKEAASAGHLSTELPE